jgi:hypothetical protein
VISSHLKGNRMKKFYGLALALTLASTSVFASGPQFSNLSESDVEDVAKEFSANFAHTGVSAPETDGLWGIEVGLVAGKTASPDLKDVVDASGGDGSDVKSLYHAGLMARAHFVFDLFAEINILPEKEISDITVKNTSYEVGWNAGAFFGLPLDIALGFNMANSEMSFKQTTPVVSETSLESKTRVLWVGVSKTLLFFTPYLKVGTISADSDLKATGSILSYSPSPKESVKNSGSYLALGANLQFFFLKLGFEASQLMGVKRASGKLSFDF